MKTNVLRIAAYFLIAHYLLVTAVSFFAKGPPDIARIMITFGILVASVGALFKPRKRGWLVVAAYAVYVLIPTFLNIWPMWASPDRSLSTKLVFSMVLAVIHTPLLVAVVLVFKPANFASFKNPLPGNVP